MSAAVLMASLAASVILPEADSVAILRNAKACTDESTDKMITGLALMTELPGFIYVASPYSNYAGDNQPGLSRAAGAAAALTGELMKGGMIAYSPIAHGHYVTLNSYLDPLDHEMWMKQCMGMMEKASGLVVLQLPGWRESKGVQMEIDYFAKASKPILYIDPARLLPGFSVKGLASGSVH